MFLVDLRFGVRPAILNVHFTVILVLIHSNKKIKNSQKLNFFVANVEKQTVLWICSRKEVSCNWYKHPYFCVVFRYLM